MQYARSVFSRSLTMSLPYLTERQLAISAVRRACVLTSSVFNKLVKNETLTKDDKSPVTVGDYAAQGVISTMIHNAFPDDLIVGEEDATDLRLDSGADLRRRIVELANEAIVGPLGVGDVKEWGIGPGQALSPEALMDAIDRGNHQGGRTGRMWTIDPIDGTKGFLRGEQYAVCLSLIVDAQVQVGVIGCPNLPFDANTKGSIFVAVRGQGAEQLNIEGSNPTLISMPIMASSELNFLESVEAAHASHSTNDKISSILGITRPPIRMDSQAKYGCLARGDGGVYMRMPTGAGYKEKIWDHAPGVVLVEEAGGVITDSRGQRLDFGLGRTLGENFGVIAASKAAHPKVLEAVQKAIALEEKL
ncbi:nucleotidase HAL2 [Armillaria luteobubalina]|uniref:3'(2'),5'-bisphosphate nucleotidase n=1 Tax=Armillaria luteobubalina TaxID=153913 RepID=A0AA39Q9W2_9AGAR|nr:nucleotidase HAL2 [Armillaria luteobubalina]